MAGFMGLRGLEIKNQHEFEKERREERRREANRPLDNERRSMEKVQEILREQDGAEQQRANETQILAKKNRTTITHSMVSAIMSGRVAVLTFDDTLLTVQGIFSAVRFHHLPVVDDDGCIVGILSDRDFLRLASPFFGTINEQNRDKEVMNRKVGTVMTRNPICVGTDTEVLDAIKTMNKHRISCLPVLEKGTRRLQGIVTWKDIVRAFCPEAFDSPSDSHRLKTGVHINPESRESQRLRAKSAESVRLRAVQSGRNEPPAPAQPQPRSHGTPGIDADRITATPPTQEKLPPRPMDGPAERPGLNPPFDSDRSV